MAATIIADDIRCMVFNMQIILHFQILRKEMPSQHHSRDCLIRVSIKVKLGGGGGSVVRERRRIAIAIAYSLISAVRPRSLISPILLAISVYINTVHESRQLIDIIIK